LLRLILCLLVLVFSTALFAQTKFGIFAGPQATNVSYKISDKKQPSDYKYGLQAGATIKIPFENRLYFSPSLYYSLKGYKVTLNEPSFPPSSLAINNETQIHTIEIAPLFHIDFSARPSHLFVKFGPAIDVAISGKEKFEEIDGDIVNQKMKFSFVDYGRITASTIVHLGYEAKNGLFIYGHYAHGIGSMNNADNGPRILHRVFGISIGKYFWRYPNFIDTRNRE
jgi:hypothetical protein